MFEYKDFWDAQVILIIIYHLYLDLVTGSISYFVTVARFSLKHLQAKHVEPSLIDDTVDTVKWMMSEPWMVGGDTEGPGCIMQHWCDQQWGDFNNSHDIIVPELMTQILKFCDFNTVVWAGIDWSAGFMTFPIVVFLFNGASSMNMLLV